MLVSTGEQIRELLLIGGIVLGLAVILLIIIIVLKRRSKDKEE